MENRENEPRQRSLGGRGRLPDAKRAKPAEKTGGNGLPRTALNPGKRGPAAGLPGPAPAGPTSPPTPPPGAPLPALPGPGALPAASGPAEARRPPSPALPQAAAGRRRAALRAGAPPAPRAGPPYRRSEKEPRPPARTGRTPGPGSLVAAGGARLGRRRSPSAGAGRGGCRAARNGSRRAGAGRRAPAAPLCTDCGGGVGVFFSSQSGARGAGTGHRSLRYQGCSNDPQRDGSPRLLGGAGGGVASP